MVISSGCPRTSEGLRQQTEVLDLEHPGRSLSEDVEASEHAGNVKNSKMETASTDD